MKTEVELGKEYKDQYTKFTGIAVARCTHLYGCIRVAVESKTKVNPETLEPIELWFDEQRLLPKSKAGNGGPQKLPMKFKQEKRRQ